MPPGGDGGTPDAPPRCRCRRPPRAYQLASVRITTAAAQVVGASLTDVPRGRVETSRSLAARRWAANGTMRPYTALRGTGFFALYFFALPGVFVALNDWLDWPRWQNAVLDAIGTLLIVSAIGVCLHCAWLFRTLGRGTPVPTQPPSRIVDSGLFRFSRNPMYVAYIAAGLGFFFVAGHLALLFYPLALFILAELYLVKVEEPRLIERFGVEYQGYCQRVPRWLRRGSAG